MLTSHDYNGKSHQLTVSSEEFSSNCSNAGILTIELLRSKTTIQIRMDKILRRWDDIIILKIIIDFDCSCVLTLSKKFCRQDNKLKFDVNL